MLFGWDKSDVGKWGNSSSRISGRRQYSFLDAAKHRTDMSIAADHVQGSVAPIIPHLGEGLVPILLRKLLDFVQLPKPTR